MADQKLLIAWNGATNDDLYINLIWVPFYDKDINFPSWTYTHAAVTSQNLTRPIVVWTDTKSDVNISLEHRSGNYNGPTLATVFGFGPVSAYRWIGDIGDAPLTTSVVIADKMPFVAWGFQDNVAKTTIACHAQDWDTTMNWNWTSNNMIETKQGPSLIYVNKQYIYNLCIRDAGSDTINLLVSDPDSIKQGIYAAGTGRDIPWDTYAAQFSGRKFLGQPVVVTSQRSDELFSRLHVWIRTDLNDEHPERLWYFWVKIGQNTSKPQRKADGSLDVQDAGFVDTGPHRIRSQPAAVVWPNAAGVNHCFLLTQTTNSHFMPWTKVTDDPASTWSVPKFGSGPPDFNYLPDNKGGGLSACLVSADFASQ